MMFGRQRVELAPPARRGRRRRGRAAGRSAPTAGRCGPRCSAKASVSSAAASTESSSHHRPADLGLGRRRVLAGVLGDPLPPARQVAAQGRQRDHRVAGRARRAPSRSPSDSSRGVAESFHSRVGVSRAIRRSGDGAGTGRSARSRSVAWLARSSAVIVRRVDWGKHGSVGTVRACRTVPTAVLVQPVVSARPRGRVAGGLRRAPCGSGPGSRAEQATEGLVDVGTVCDDLEPELAAVLDDLHDVGRLDGVAVLRPA